MYKLGLLIYDKVAIGKGRAGFLTQNNMWHNISFISIIFRS